MSARRKIINKLVDLFTKGDNLDEPAQGYIYNILDTKKGKNYVGSKLGAIDKTEDYLGSGTIIKRIAKKRPNDLYKTILGKTNTRREMMTQEEAWLKAYRAAQDDNMYNLKNSYRGHLGAKFTDSHKSKLGIKGNTFGTKNKGKVRTAEQKRKMSETKKGTTPWNKGKKGLQVSHNKGKKLSAETRRKLSEANKGKSPPNKGKKATPEQVRKNRESHMGQEAWNKGKSWSEETKRKQSEAHKGKPWTEARRKAQQLKGLLDD